VGISSDDRVGVEHAVSVEHNSGEVLQVNLMDDTGARGHDLELVESSGAPLEEGESLVVSFEFKFFVLLLGVSGARDIDLDGVIDDQVDGAEGVDLVGVTTESCHSISHGSQVNDSGYSSEVLQDNSSWLEGDLRTLLRGFLPVEDLLHI